MALTIRLLQHKKRELNGKWYGRVKKGDEVNTAQMAKNISDITTFTEADIHGAVIALVSEMKLQLQRGNTVVLDGFGRFHLSIQSDMVDDPKQYNLKRHVKNILCRFTPAGKRNATTRQLERPFTEGVELIMEE